MQQTNREFSSFSGATNPHIQPPFDPELGTTVFAPEGSGSGWWVGAPGCLLVDGTWYLTFRTRRPQPERGGLFQIATSTDGEHFTVIDSIRKESLGTPSIERGTLIRTDNCSWRLYLSYVDPADGRWRIDMFEADSPDQLSMATPHPILTATDIGTEGVKDPWICKLDGTWHLIVSYAPTPSGATPEAMHGTRDIYNTGTSKSLSGIATSEDGLSWKWHGSILEPSEDSWDEYAARINTVYTDGNQFIALYDGSKSVAENYEERCAAAVSTDLKHWTKASTPGPIAGPNGGPGSVRYAECVQTDSGNRFFYEYTRQDGSHELRTIWIPA